MKTFLEFITESNRVTYDYSCIMLNVHESEIFQNILNSLNEEDLHEYGKELDPHITVLYGIERTVDDEDIKEFISNINPFELKSNSLSLFEKEEYDVLKFDIIPTPELLALREDSMQKFENVQTFPDYKPHVTVAYLKKGKGKDYLVDLQDEVIFHFKNVKFSKYDGTEVQTDIVEIPTDENN